jgi:hypothetical protein
MPTLGYIFQNANILKNPASRARSLFFKECQGAIDDDVTTKKNIIELKFHPVSSR